MIRAAQEAMAAKLRDAGWRVIAPEHIDPAPRVLAEKNDLADDQGFQRNPGSDPKTGKYSTAQMLRDEMYGGDTDQPLFD